jgi:nicotinamide phosphoribosyltransferase
MYSNVILLADSYKYSQFNQYPPGTEHVYSYIQSRGGDYDTGVFLGWQAFQRQYLSKPVTREDIDEAEAIIKAHGEPFNRAGWEYIVENHGGYLPLKVMSLQEGTKFDPHANVPLLTIVNTDKMCFWLPSFMETAILRAIWYPTTVASNSFASRRVIKDFLERTGDVGGLDFKLHDFGARGVSSAESSGLGGLAHLAVGFKGTDNVSALLAAKRFYGAEMAGFSIPAMEHSTVTSWGREGEVDSYRNMLQKYGKPDMLFAAVSDSYNIYEAVTNLWGGTLRDEVVASGATLVVRPDSGVPHLVVSQVVKLLDSRFGSTRNSTGYKVLNNVRVIQGDGINTREIFRILQNLEVAGYSADNVAFGQGGALLQQVNRDTMSFAMKCSAIRINGTWRGVYKDPIGDSGKRSMRGRFNVVREDTSLDIRGGFKLTAGLPDTTYALRAAEYNPQSENYLKLRFLNGEFCNETTFDQVRAAAS